MSNKWTRLFSLLKIMSQTANTAETFRVWVRGAMQRHSSFDAEANRNQCSTAELVGSYLPAMKNWKKITRRMEWSVRLLCLSRIIKKMLFSIVTARDGVASNTDHRPGSWVDSWDFSACQYSHCCPVTSTGVPHESFEITDRHVANMIPGSADEECGDPMEWADIATEEGEGALSYLVNR